MAMRSLTRRAPSGDVVTVSWEGAAPISEVAGVRFAGGSYGRGFQVHPLGAHDFALKHVTAAKATSRVLVGRHEVKLATTPDRHTTVATLVGTHHELMTIFQGPAPAANVIAELFGALDIDDEQHGMRVAPRDESLLSVMNEHLVLVNDDSTSLDLPAPAQASQLVPAHRGAKTKHGEVWRALLPGRSGRNPHDYSYVVGTRLGAADVVAASPDAVSGTGLLAMVDSVNIAWAPRKAKGRTR